MINKRLISFAPKSLHFVALNFFLQVAGLFANIFMIFSICSLFEQMFKFSATRQIVLQTLAVIFAVLFVRFFLTKYESLASFHAAKFIKLSLRTEVFRKIERLGPSYSEKASTAELVQETVEGIDQLETYFGQYLPQFFYAICAPLILFFVLLPVSAICAVALLICVPLIPVTIALVQTFAKKLLAKYWGQYTKLGSSFLENLQGLTTLKIYQTDDLKNEEMNRESEEFRKITMKVLTMQLNSISIMDLTAYGGAAFGIILAVVQFCAKNISIGESIAIILLSADFFIPMRKLGSFFHIAMNGTAAANRIFKFLDSDEISGGNFDFPPSDKNNFQIQIDKLDFSYDSKRKILSDISMNFPKGNLTAIVGESGSGKSTIAKILCGVNKNYSGSVRFMPFDVDLNSLKSAELCQNVQYIGARPFLFSGTVRENLLIANPSANDGKMWEILDKVKISDFLNSENGLDTKVLENGSNFSGGQRQRLALARSLLHGAQVFIFDESLSSVDADSENEIMTLIYEIAKTKIVILISHRIENVKNAGNIYVLENGKIIESGVHENLVLQGKVYANLWKTQTELVDSINSKISVKVGGQNAE